MTRGKRHSQAEISAKLAEADGLASQGKLQSDIANALGVSVMTLHRWRHRPSSNAPLSSEAVASILAEQEPGKSPRLSELQYENSRLRRLVIDLLLEKMKLEDTARIKPEARTKQSRPGTIVRTESQAPRPASRPPLAPIDC
jgi:putative transposase